MNTAKILDNNEVAIETETDCQIKAEIIKKMRTLDPFYVEEEDDDDDMFLLDEDEDEDDDEDKDSFKDEESKLAAALMKAYTGTHNAAAEYRQNRLKEIFNKYSYMFTEGINERCVLPVGWLQHFENALNIFASTGMQILIERIVVNSAGIRIEVAGEHSLIFRKNSGIRNHADVAKSMFDSLVKFIPETCVLCGTYCKMPVGSDLRVKNKQIYEVLCKRCISIFDDRSTADEISSSHIKI